MEQKDKYENVGQALAHIQQNIKAPKSRENKFGGYKYRAQEDILEAVKPLLKNAVLTITDEIVEVGGRIYVKAVASLTCEGSFFQNISYAREPENKKGMDESQITGAASSYARKYALNGLFLIDDTQDADATNTHENKSAVETNGSVAPMDKTGNRATDKWVNNAVADLSASTDLGKHQTLFAKYWVDAKKKGCTQDQVGMIKDQYDATKARLEREGDDDIPDFYEASHMNEIMYGKDA